MNEWINPHQQSRCECKELTEKVRFDRVRIW